MDNPIKWRSKMEKTRKVEKRIAACRREWRLRREHLWRTGVAFIRFKRHNSYCEGDKYHQLEQLFLQLL